jgi:chromosome segregation ATPase
MRLRQLAIGAVGLALAGNGAMVAAQTTRTGGADARAMQQLQQQTAELATMKSENARLKQQLDDLQKKLDAMTAQQGALARRAQAAESASSRIATSSSANSESAQRTRVQLEEVVGRFRETAQTLKEVETERNTLKQQAQATERQLATCRDDNAELIRINEEVLVRLENTGFWTKLAADEPFTQLKRTKLENLAEEYRSRAADLAVKSPPAPAQ